MCQNPQSNFTEQTFWRFRSEDSNLLKEKSIFLLRYFFQRDCTSFVYHFVLKASFVGLYQVFASISKRYFVCSTNFHKLIFNPRCFCKENVAQTCFMTISFTTERFWKHMWKLNRFCCFLNFHFHVLFNGLRITSLHCNNNYNTSFTIYRWKIIHCLM